jgi:DNA-binding LacI/PurR family transcriptional regulator
MTQIKLLSFSEQVAALLRAELLNGTLRGQMPGVLRLEEELGVNRKTVEAALQQLEREGLLEGQGAGRRRRILPQAGGAAVRPLRIAILPGEEADRREDYLIEVQHELEKAGHQAFFLPTSLTDLGMTVSRIARLVKRTDTDAWVVVSGSREVLEWFSVQPVPALAMFGRRRGIPLASVGPDKTSAMTAATRELIALGHRRIVLLARTRRRLPVPGAPEQAMLDEMKAHGLEVSAYNLPAWEEGIKGFNFCLESLFKVTPPTALIIDEASLYVAALQFLCGRRLRVPEDVSLVCTDGSSTFAWCDPPVSHIHWERRPCVRRIVRWAANVSRGKPDLQEVPTPTRFVHGGTIGPVAR